jgi:imidazole glycerol-phosphate synthase subunit HisH
VNIAVVKYNAGNIESVCNSLERLGVTACVTDSPEELKNADKVIFPGVGEASSAMQYLRQKRARQVAAEPRAAVSRDMLWNAAYVRKQPGRRRYLLRHI